MKWPVYKRFLQGEKAAGQGVKAYFCIVQNGRNGHSMVKERKADVCVEFKAEKI
jgi:hypothetical protein